MNPLEKARTAAEIAFAIAQAAQGPMPLPQQYEEHYQRRLEDSIVQPVQQPPYGYPRK